MERIEAGVGGLVPLDRPPQWLPGRNFDYDKHQWRADPLPSDDRVSRARVRQSSETGDLKAEA